MELTVESYNKMRAEYKGNKTINREFPEFYLNRSYLPNSAFKLGYKTYSKTITEEELLQIKSCNTLSYKFWVFKGYSEDEAKNKIRITQANNTAKKLAKYTKEEARKFNHRTKEYYIVKGYSENEAKTIISESQKTFTLEKCIDRHGVMEGYKSWRIRQIEWQNTLQNKSKLELNLINKSKGKTFGQMTEKFGIDRAKDIITSRSIKFGRASNESLTVFGPIFNYCVDELDLLPENIRLGINSSYEMSLFNNDNTKHYMYDFTILGINVIIEFNGVAFHPKTPDLNWSSPYGANGETSYYQYEEKLKVAKELGYNILVLWSDESIINNINLCKAFINKHLENYEKNNGENREVV